MRAQLDVILVHIEGLISIYLFLFVFVFVVVQKEFS